MRNISARERYPGQVLLGVGVAGILCLWGAFQSFQAEVNYQQQYTDAYSVSVQVDRLSPLQSAVSKDAILGYLTDVDAGSEIDSVMINTAGYVLAPRLIERTGTHRWVLGNFLRPGDFAEVGRKNGLRLERDFGKGVVLFRREH